MGVLVAKAKKKKVTIGGIAAVLVASGALSIQQGDTGAGTILVIIGLVCLLMAKYVEE